MPVRKYGTEKELGVVKPSGGETVGLLTAALKEK